MNGRSGTKGIVMRLPEPYAVDAEQPQEIRPSRHPYHVLMRVLHREGRLISRINHTFIDGNVEYRKRLFQIFFENENLKQILADRANHNDIHISGGGSVY